MKLPLHLIDKTLFTFNFEEYKQYSWVRNMFSTEQDKTHHAEGNVGIHTEMVMHSLIGLNGFKTLSHEEKKIMFLGALFHDVEKRSTTREENGNIISPGHAKKGEISTRSILYKNFEVDFHTREQICKIVRHHGLPLWIFSKPNPIKSLTESSIVSNNFWLYLISLADVHGRFCEDKDDLFYRIELFKEYANESNILNQPKSFKDNHSKVLFFEKEDSFVDYVPFDDTQFEVIVMSGLPGSGKDYYIENNFSIPVISLDELRRKYKIKPNDKYGTGFIIQTAKERAREYLRKKEPFVWNGTNITKQIREQVVGLIRSYNARVKIIYIETPYVKLKNQNKNREYPIPNIELEKFISKVEIPSPTEAHIVEYKIHS